MVHLSHDLYAAAELLDLAIAEHMQRAPDAPMTYAFDDGQQVVVESNQWRRGWAEGQVSALMFRMLRCGELTPRGPSGIARPVEPEEPMLDVRRYCVLDRADAEKYLRACTIAVETAAAALVQESNQGAPARIPLSRHEYQESEILRVLRELGYDPLRLPRAPAGKPGPKAEARENLKPPMSAAVFKKAWERLRGSGDIADAD